jgi:hypothetical protein
MGLTPVPISLQIVLMIVVGAIAYRSATYIFNQIRVGGYAARRLAVTFRGPARSLLNLYVVAGLPIAFLNGFLLRFSWRDCIIVGVGTWTGLLVAIFFGRGFNPVFQFYVFAGLNLVWLCVNVIEACMGK